MRRQSRLRLLWARLGSVRYRALLSLGIVVVLGSGGSFAYWSDSATVTGPTLSAGTIDLKVNTLDAVTGYTSLNIGNMVPGNTVAGVLTVKNAGTAPFTYSMDAAGTNADGKNLVGALVAKVTGDTTVMGSSPTATCAGTALANTGTSFSTNLISSTTPRSLSAGASEIICIQATLPATASTTLQGATTNLSFTLTANQLQ